MGSPIEQWEGAAAIFTGAQSSISIWAFLLISIAFTVVVVIDSAKHEDEAYNKKTD